MRCPGPPGERTFEAVECAHDRAKYLLSIYVQETVCFTMQFSFHLFGQNLQ